MRPQGVDARIIGTLRPIKRFQARAGGDVGRQGQIDRPSNDQRPHAHHLRRAVKQRQPFLGQQVNRRKSGAPQGCRAVEPLTCEGGLAFADHYQRQMSQRGQITAGAERTLGGDARRDTGIEHVQQKLDDCRSDTRVTKNQRVGPSQHDGAYGLRRQVRPYTDRMAAYEVELQLLDFIGRNDPVLESAEAGRDTVDDTTLADQLIDSQATTFNFG